MKHPIQNIKSREEITLLFPPGGVGAELGVDNGDHAASLIATTSAERIYLVDFWSFNASRPGFEEWAEKKRHVETRFAREIAAGRVFVVDSSFADFLAGFPDGFFNWLYLDGWHGYDEVTRDLAIVAAKLKRGAVAAGHDFKIEPKDWGTGCCRAVLELVQSGFGPLIGLSDEENSDWVIRKGGFSL